MMEIEEDLMSVELRFADLVTLALPDIRTIMQKTNIEDHEIIFAVELPRFGGEFFA